MKKYPEIGEQVRVKGEVGLHIVKKLYSNFRLPVGGTTYVVLPGDVTLDDGRIVGLEEIITRHQKYITIYVIQVFYDKWEDETQEETWSEAIQRRKEYRENVARPVRLIRRKEVNPLYREGA